MDQGTDMLLALNWWHKTGIKDAAGIRHKLGAFTAIDVSGPRERLPSRRAIVHSPRLSPRHSEDLWRVSAYAQEAPLTCRTCID
jgi:hypothetical protein